MIFKYNLGPKQLPITQDKKHEAKHGAKQTLLLCLRQLCQFSVIQMCVQENHLVILATIHELLSSPTVKLPL